MLQNSYDGSVAKILDRQKESAVAQYLNSIRNNDNFNGFQSSLLCEKLSDMTEIDSGVLEFIEAGKIKFITPVMVDVEELILPARIEVDGKDVMLVDARPFARTDRKDEYGVIIADITALYVAVHHAYLEYKWKDEQSRNVMLYDYTTALRTWVDWIASALSQARNLTPADQIELRAVLGLFWIESNLPDTARYDDNDRQETALLLRSSLGLDLQRVILPAVNKHMPLRTLDALVESMKQISIRLDTMNPTILVGVLRNGTWLGTRAGVYSSLALEYPPMFLALWFTLTLTSGNFLLNRTRIGQSAQNIIRKQELSHEYRALERLK